MASKERSNAYDQVVLAVFRKHWRKGARDVPFTKDDLIEEAARIGLTVKNFADILYTYRSRRALPGDILRHGNWVITAKGAGKYAFQAVTGLSIIEIPAHLKVYQIPCAVPDIVSSNLARDEQGLLTVVRYNRLLDVFTGLACFHLQSHVRTHIKGHGQVEVDELYVGIDKDGQGFVLPVEAKDVGESLGVGKVVALTLFGQHKYPSLVCRPIAVVRESEARITCIEFEPVTDIAKVAIVEVRRYNLIKESP